MQGFPVGGIQHEVPGFYLAQEFSPTRSLIQHLVGIADPAPAHGNTLNQGFDLGQRIRIALQCDGIKNNALQHLTYPEAGAAGIRWR